MLKDLIKQFGKDKINTFTKYPSILTLHKFGEKGKLTDEFTTNILNENMFATEKIDGTNARIICFGSEYLIGSREFILHHNEDLYFDNSQLIVQGLKDLKIKIPQTEKLTVIYGEFYGGKTSANSKWYGKDKNGFKVFDIAIYDDLSILELSQESISKWRERETDKGIIYGQKFMKYSDMKNQFNQFEYVPNIPFELNDFTHISVLQSLNCFIPNTMVSLSDVATKKAEGLILRNENRSKIVKLRFEDYLRAIQ